MAKARATTGRGARSKYPFLFIGEGFGTSYKCLEGYVWFVSAPPAKDKKAIVALLPEPMRVIARIDGDLLQYGSDDALESRVKVAYSTAYKHRDRAEAFEELEQLWQAGGDEHVPSKAEWKRFCDDFAASVRTIHERWPIRLVLKPDNGEYGGSPGAWHRWSLHPDLLVMIVRVATSRTKTSRGMSYLAANLIQTVLADRPPKNAANVASWITWLEKLVREGAKDLDDTFVEYIDQMLELVPRQAATLEQSLAPATRKKLLAVREG